VGKKKERLNPELGSKGIRIGQLAEGLNSKQVFLGLI
jgi:hypothetical protein